MTHCRVSTPRGAIGWKSGPAALHAQPPTAIVRTRSGPLRRSQPAAATPARIRRACDHSAAAGQTAKASATPMSTARPDARRSGLAVSDLSAAVSTDAKPASAPANKQSNLRRRATGSVAMEDEADPAVRRAWVAIDLDPIIVVRRHGQIPQTVLRLKRHLGKLRPPIEHRGADLVDEVLDRQGDEPVEHGP